MFRRVKAGRLEPVAIGWGGLLGGAGLIAAAAAGMPLGPAIGLAGCLVGGFMAGIRAGGRRATHGIFVGGLALLFYVAFIALAHLARLIGADATAPDLVPDRSIWWALVPLSLIATTLGAVLADRTLRPRRPRRLGP